MLRSKGTSVPFFVPACRRVLRLVMARLPRLILAGLPHLLSQRAQHGQAMVRDDEDRGALLRLLHDAATQHRVALHAYAVLDGRFDLVATPEAPEGLSLLMQAVARRHAAAYNRRHGRSGGLWEGRFRAAVVEPEPWLLRCMIYVEQLPLYEAVGDESAMPAWSSQAAHFGAAADALLSHPPAYWSLGNTPFEREAAYRRRFERGLTSAELLAVEQALRGGWVLGSNDFAERLRHSSGRPARPRAPGRPRKAVVDVSPIIGLKGKRPD